MRTFFITTLGCKVNQYESEQIASLLRARGLTQVQQPEQADLRIVNSCSVTIQAASKSRQTVRQMVRLPVMNGSVVSGLADGADSSSKSAHQRTIVTGCWATGDKASAARLPGVSAVITHHDDVAKELDRFLALFHCEDQQPPNQSLPLTTTPNLKQPQPAPGLLGDKGWMKHTSAPAQRPDVPNKSHSQFPVKKKLSSLTQFSGAASLPLLDAHQDSHQRAFLKIQDGCDAHCTYCIIPSLRPRLWSKPIAMAVEEARRLVSTGHVELVLTGIFLGAFGHETALRRRQEGNSGKPLADLIDALCTQVPGLQRLRLSSLEPGDLSGELLRALQNHPQVVPHFHLPLQSGSDTLLHRMNRQYTRTDFLRMIDEVNSSFDKPALTTDIIVGFPGETDQEFNRTLGVVDYARFIHIHAFSFSPRPGTAAARWKADFIHGPVVNQRIDLLRSRAADHSLAFRQQFLGQTVQVLVERQPDDPQDLDPALRHGRCERYFPIFFDAPHLNPGDLATLRINRVTPHRTFGTLEHP